MDQQLTQFYYILLESLRLEIFVPVDLLIFFLGGGFTYSLFSPLFGEMIQFDYMFQMG